MRHFFVILIGITISACSGTPPTNLGVINGQLAKCPDSPNCVSSFDDQNDSVHYIEPIRFTSANSPRKNLEKAIISIAGVTVIESKPNYIYAEFQSRLMKYVDDVEFYIVPKQQLIHVRSASRLGYGDLGVNRKRIEILRTMLINNTQPY